ncbi:hypothetical protein BC629DRAFT_1589496 [Irpex lacteus]|nr:hypothetical protein BC629DRAFT_1589496 [Irpex lacteus]
MATPRPRSSFSTHFAPLEAAGQDTSPNFTSTNRELAVTSLRGSSEFLHSPSPQRGMSTNMVMGQVQDGSRLQRYTGSSSSPPDWDKMIPFDRNELDEPAYNGSYHDARYEHSTANRMPPPTRTMSATAAQHSERATSGSGQSLTLSEHQLHDLCSRVAQETVRSLHAAQGLPTDERNTASSVAGSPRLDQLDFAEYGDKVLFWNLSDWKKVEKSMEKLSSILPFLKNADGTPLAKEECERLRGDARNVFYSIIGSTDNPPVSWYYYATSEQRQRFRFEMESRHEILRYCNGGWKSEALATLVYPQVKNTLVRRSRRAVEDGLKTEAEVALWLKPTSSKRRKSEGTVDPTMQARKRKQAPKTVIPEESHQPKQRPALNIVNAISASRAQTLGSSNDLIDLQGSPDVSGSTTIVHSGVASQTMPPQMVDVAQSALIEDAVQDTSATTVLSGTAVVGSPSLSAGPVVSSTPVNSDHPTTLAIAATSSATAGGLSATPTNGSTPSTNAGAASIAPIEAETTSLSSEGMTAPLPTSSKHVSPSSAPTCSPSEKLNAPSNATRSKIFTPGGRNTVRDVVGQDWKVGNPNGTCADFKLYWTEIQRDSERIKPYQDRVNEAKSSLSAAQRAKAGEEGRPGRRSKV